MKKFYIYKSLIQDAVDPYSYREKANLFPFAAEIDGPMTEADAEVAVITLNAATKETRR